MHAKFGALDDSKGNYGSFKIFYPDSITFFTICKILWSKFYTLTSFFNNIVDLKDVIMHKLNV